jgi:tRNA A-37 threonylcarbamoyl transferase component Bud32
MNGQISSTDSLPETIPGFEIERQLAQGGMATVYLATQLSLNRKVALKVLRAFNDPEHKERFFNESRIIASLNHRNIITIHDVGQIGECAFLSMEYYQGNDLASRISQGPLDPCTALEITASIGDCLGFAHAHGIVHRDVKPANILFHQDSTPILTDFGIATDVTVDSNLTASGMTIGTPCYVSPEQVQGVATDGRSDIYSLGIVLYEMLVGQPPFSEGSAVEIMAAQVNLPPPLLPEHLHEFQPLLERMLAKKPAERFATASDLVDAVRDCQINSAGVGGNRHQQPLRELTYRLAAAFEWPRRAIQEAFRHRSVVIASFAVFALGISWIVVGVLRGPNPVDEYLDKADQAFEEDRLAYPVAESAFYYYREVRAIDPENDDALEGLHDIAEIYADRAEGDLVKSNFPSAKFHIDRGLEVEPTNERLRKLRRDTKGLRRIPEKVFSGIKSIFR